MSPEYPDIPADVLSRAKRRILVLIVFTVVLSVSYYLWLRSHTDRGIDDLDIFLAAGLGLLIIGAAYFGWRKGMDRLSERYRAQNAAGSRDVV